MPKTNNNLFSIILRYLVILFFGLFNLAIIYFVFTPLTIYPVYSILSLFYQVTLSGISIILNNFYQIDIIEACVAGSAYYLLLILNLSTPMKPKQLAYSLVFCLISPLILNILRIIFLSFLFTNNLALFDITHKIFWYFISTIFVVILWFLSVKLFNIKEIPVYSDIKYILKILS